MFSWKKAAIVAGLAFVFSCQSLTSTNRNVAQQQDDQNQEVQYFDRLQDYTPYKYEVLFTDPVCGVYNYTEEVLSNSGKKLTQKPENVYCKAQYDRYRSGNRPQSPQFRLIEWINSPDTKEIFLTYLSFSNKTVKEALCEAAKRGVKIRLVMSSEGLEMSDELLKCKKGDEVMVERKLRGQENGLGYAHNKFFIINPNTKKEFKIVFSSGNMSSGPVTHHENWNFITTNANSQFAQAHVCAMRAEWDETSGRSRQAYINSIRSCRDSIKAPVEKDIKVFFVPGEGVKEPGINFKTATDYMIEGDAEAKTPGIKNASRIWIACHRFLYSKMRYALSNRLSDNYRPDMRIVCDDDTYYKGTDKRYTEGDTSVEEYDYLAQLADVGYKPTYTNKKTQELTIYKQNLKVYNQDVLAKIKFLETNSSEHQLHHSKYLIFADKNSGVDSPSDFTAVFTGSANLTGAGFNKNWENSYYVTIPTVVQKFAEHYIHTWNDLATSRSNLPADGVQIETKLIDQPIIKNKTENK